MLPFARFGIKRRWWAGSCSQLQPIWSLQKTSAIQLPCSRHQLFDATSCLLACHGLPRSHRQRRKTLRDHRQSICPRRSKMRLGPSWLPIVDRGLRGAVAMLRCISPCPSVPRFRAASQALSLLLSTFQSRDCSRMWQTVQAARSSENGVNEVQRTATKSATHTAHRGPTRELPTI